MPESFTQRAWAAVLWSGGTLSHRSAAELWSLPVLRSSTIHVTVARQVLKGYGRVDVPTEHVPTRREAARHKFAALLDDVALEG